MTIDLTKIFKKHRGLRVTFKEDNKTVIASGKTVREAMKKAQKKGFEQPILFHVPIKILPYVGKKDFSIFLLLSSAY